MRLRVALLLVGAWLALTGNVALVAGGNFRAVDAFAADPGPTREVLRAFAVDRNRELFRHWAWIQGAVAVAVAGCALSERHLGRGGKLLAVLVLAVALVLGAVLTPRLLEPAALATAEARRRFLALHGGFMGLQLLEALLLLWLGALLVRWRDRPRFDYGPGD